MPKSQEKLSPNLLHNPIIGQGLNRNSLIISVLRRPYPRQLGVSWEF